VCVRIVFIVKIRGLFDMKIKDYDFNPKGIILAVSPESVPNQFFLVLQKRYSHSGVAGIVFVTYAKPCRAVAVAKFQGSEVLRFVRGKFVNTDVLPLFDDIQESCCNNGLLHYL